MLTCPRLAKEIAKRGSCQIWNVPQLQSSRKLYVVKITQLIDCVSRLPTY